MAKVPAIWPSQYKFLVTNEFLTQKCVCNKNSKEQINNASSSDYQPANNNFKIIRCNILHGGNDMKQQIVKVKAIK